MILRYLSVWRPGRLMMINVDDNDEDIHGRCRLSSEDRRTGEVSNVKSMCLQSSSDDDICQEYSP